MRQITVADFLDKWDRDYAIQNVTPKTRERYNQLIKNQINPNIGLVLLQKLRPANLAELYAKLMKKRFVGADGLSRSPASAPCALASQRLGDR